MTESNALNPDLTLAEAMLSERLEQDSRALTPGEQAMLNQINALVGEEMPQARKRELALHLARNQATVEGLLIEMLVKALDGILTPYGRGKSSMTTLEKDRLFSAQAALRRANEAGYGL